MGKSPSDSRRRRTKSKRAMKLAIYVLFLAAASTGAPSLPLKRNMPIGHAENTLAENQKQTSMKIQNEVTPWIQHLENILKLSIERQHNETSQLYKYIDASISHVTAELVKRIKDLKENTDESLKALEENTKENLNSLKTITEDILTSRVGGHKGPACTKRVLRPFPHLLCFHETPGCSPESRFSACCSSYRPFNRLGVLVVQGANAQHDCSPRRDRDYQPPEPFTND